MSPQGRHHKETGGVSMEPPPAPVLELLAAAVSSQHCQQCVLGQYPVGFTGLDNMGNPIPKNISLNVVIHSLFMMYLHAEFQDAGEQVVSSPAACS